MMMHSALKALFEEQIAFKLADGTPVDGSVFIGSTEFLPVEIILGDSVAYNEEFNAWLEDAWLPEQEERREQILKLYGNKQRYKDLRDAVVRRQVVPFIGSGMSAPSGLPTWSELLRKIRSYTTIKEDVFEKLLDECAFEQAADLLASAANPNLINERVEHDLRFDNPQLISGPVRLLPILFPNLVITTNLDNLLEQHYTNCDGGFTNVLAGIRIATYRQVRSPDKSILLKIHGDCQDADNRILLKTEYEKAYAPGSTVREEVTLLYRNNNLLFLGCSLGPDRTVELVTEVACNDKYIPRHYALLADPEVNTKRIERENFLTRCSIYPIWYDGDHDSAIMALLAGLIEKNRI